MTNREQISVALPAELREFVKALQSARIGA
jgi:hypothetical protein